jgi:hypothetical protein
VLPYKSDDSDKPLMTLSPTSAESKNKKNAKAYIFIDVVTKSVISLVLWFFFSAKRFSKHLKSASSLITLTLLTVERYYRNMCITHDYVRRYVNSRYKMYSDGGTLA